MVKLAEIYDLKDNVKAPERYLGNNIVKCQLLDGREAWVLASKDYVMKLPGGYNVQNNLIPRHTAQN